MLLINRVLMIALTILLAVCLSIMPLPVWVNWLRPEWVTLIVCYWVFIYPDYVNVGVCWIIGLLLDALYGTILGEHALAMACVAYLMLRLERKIRHYQPFTQSLYIFFCSFIYNLILFVIQWILGQTITDWRFWISPVFSIILWPILFEVFKKIQLKLRV